jgi:dihydroxyacetone kinase-like protein
VAVKDSLYTAGRRGVATTVLCEKLVGAAAEAGYDLARCEALARRINNQSRTIGVAMHACTVPAAGKPSFTLADNEVEFGVGIHGEPGIERRPFTNLNALVDDMFKELTDNSPYGRTLRHWDRASGSWQEEHTFIEPFNKGDRVIAWSTASAAPRSPSSTASMAASPPCAKRRASIWCATSSAPTAPLST